MFEDPSQTGRGLGKVVCRRVGLLHGSACQRGNWTLCADIKRGFLSELSVLMKSSCSNTADVGKEEDVLQNEMIWIKPLAFVSLLINITSTVEVRRPDGRNPFIRDREANRHHVTSTSFISAVATFPHAQLPLNEIENIKLHSDEDA